MDKEVKLDDIGVGQQVLTLSLPYLEFKESLSARLVSHRTNAAWLNLRASRHCGLTLKGSINFTSSADIEALLSSAIPACRLRLQDLRLNEFFFTDPIYFRQFVTKYDGVLRSLHLTSCILTMGRFMELIAFLSLRDLRIVDCPTLLQTDMQIAAFAHLIPLFIQQMRQLHSFDLRGRKLTTENQHVLLQLLNRGCLHRLQLSTPRSCYGLNAKAITSCLHANARRIQTLHLAGTLQIDLPFINDGLDGICLKHLSLQGVRIDPKVATSFCVQFFSKQKLLEVLSLRATIIPPGFHFSGINRIRRVHFQDCVFPPAVEELWNSLSWHTTLESLSVGFARPGCELAGTFHPKALRKLFSKPMVNLRTLAIRNIRPRPLVFLEEFARACRNVKTLSIVGCTVPSSSLKHIYQLSKLKALTLQACGLGCNEAIYQGKFQGGGDGTCSFGCIQSLQYLDLSHNPKLKEIAMVEIRLLKELRILKLDHTGMTGHVMEDMIRKLKRNKVSLAAGGTIEMVQGMNSPKLPKLALVSLQGCAGCSLPPRGYKLLSRELWPLSIDVDLDLTGGELTEIATNH